MPNLKNILTIAGLGLVTSLNAQNPEERNTAKFYNNQGQLERVIINGAGKIDTIHYKYNKEGKVFQKIIKNKEGIEKTSYKYDNKGKKIEYQFKNDYIYDSEGNFLKKVIKIDEDGDGIYEQQYECICGSPAV